MNSPADPMPQQAGGLAALLAAKVSARQEAGSLLMSPRTLTKARIEEKRWLALATSKMNMRQLQDEISEDAAVPQTLVVSGVDSAPDMNGMYDRINDFHGRPQWMMEGTRRYVRWIRGSWELYVSHHPSGTTFFYAHGALPPISGWTPTEYVSSADDPVFKRHNVSATCIGAMSEMGLDVQTAAPKGQPEDKGKGKLTKPNFAAAIAAKASAIANSNMRSAEANMAQAHQVADDAIAQNKVVIFSKEYCRHCIKAKAAFDKLGYEGKYAVVELERGTLQFKEDDPYSFHDGTLVFKTEHVNPAGMPSLTYLHPMQ